MAEYTDEEARKAIKRLARKDREDSRKSGTIISVRGRKASVVIEGENSVVSAHRGLFEPIIGAYVAIELIPGTQNWKIVGVGDAALAATDTLPYDIEYQGTPIYYPIALEAINNGAYNLAATGLEMTVYNIQYVNENGVFHFIESTLLDFATSVPVSDSRWSVVCVETADDSVVIYDDSPTATPDGAWIDAVNAAVAANPTYLPVLAIRLNTGMTDWGDAWKRLNRGYSFDNKKIVRVAYPTVPGDTGAPITDAYYQYVDADGTPQVQRGTVNFESTDTIEVLVTDNGAGDETIVSFALVNSANSFLGLSDAPHDYTGEAGKVVRVNATEDGVEFYTLPASVTDFTDLADVPAAYTGHSLKAVRVNAGETALEFYTPSFAADFTDLGDVPASYTGHSLKFVRVNAGETGLEFVVGGGGATNFTDLGDVPASYSGQALKLVRVNAGATALEFYTAPVAPVDFVDLGDVPASYSGVAGYALFVNSTEDGVEFQTIKATNIVGLPSSLTGAAGDSLRVNGTETGYEFYTPTAGVTDFTDLGDVPASYSGQALKAVRVNAGATALEFYTPAVGATAFTGLSDVPASYSGQGNKIVKVNSGATALEFTGADDLPNIKPHLCMGRLTLTSGDPIMTAAVTGATTVYFTPYHGNVVRLYDGTNWKYHTFTERSLSLSGYTADKNYDIFLYDNAGTLTLESAIWTDDTTRASAITLQDGVYVKSGATTRLLLGTIRINSTGGQTDFSANGKKLFVSNLYNRRPRVVRVDEGTNTWTYASSTVRYANNSSANRVEYVECMQDEIVDATVYMIGGGSGAAGSQSIGVDTNTANSAQFLGQVGGSQNAQAVSRYQGFPGIGFHYLAWVEWVRAGTVTWHGDGGVSTLQTGLQATIYC